MSVGDPTLTIGSWLQHVSNRLAANGYRPMRPEVYQPHGYLYGAHYSGFEITKFGMVERFFLFANIADLDANKLQQYSNATFQFANKNKSISLPNGLFTCTHVFPVVITADLDSRLAEFLRSSTPVSHWAAFEMPVVFDLANRSLHYYQTTPIWGAAYHAGFRKEVQKNLI